MKKPPVVHLHIKNKCSEYIVTYLVEEVEDVKQKLEGIEEKSCPSQLLA